jgi:hypothetical protein
VRKSFVLEQCQHLLLCVSVGVLLSIGLLACVIRPNAVIVRLTDCNAIIWQKSKVTPALAIIKHKKG